MKGFYSVLIGVIALMVLATALFTVNSFNKSQSLTAQKESFSFIVREWQNTRRVLDKATGDAIIDSGFKANCLTQPAIFRPDINIYVYDQNVVSLMNSDCTIKNFSVSKVHVLNALHSVGEVNVYDVNARMDLQCRKKIENGKDLNTLVLYEKNILFEKTVDANYRTDNSDCNIFVIDKQSNLLDANYFGAWP
jgi:hypothetical protein